MLHVLSISEGIDVIATKLWDPGDDHSPWKVTVIINNIGFLRTLLRLKSAWGVELVGKWATADNHMLPAKLFAALKLHFPGLDIDKLDICVVSKISTLS